MLYNFLILFKSIKSLIVLVSSKLCYASFPYNIRGDRGFLQRVLVATLQIF